MSGSRFPPYSSSTPPSTNGASTAEEEELAFYFTMPESLQVTSFSDPFADPFGLNDNSFGQIMRAMEPPAVEMPPYSAFERVFTSASSAQDAQYSQSTSRATIPIPEGFVAPTILPLGFQASNVDPFRPSLGIDSESSSQPLASYSCPLPTHQNGNSGSVFTSASSAQDATNFQSTSRVTIPIPEGFVAPNLLPLGFQASNLDPFRPSLGIDSESSSQPLASYSCPLPTHQNGNSGSVFTSASSAQDATNFQSTSRVTIPIPEGFVAPNLLPLGFQASNLDPFRPSLGIDSESSSQPLASYSYPLPTHQNGNSGSVPLPTHQNGNSGSSPLPVHSHTDPRLSLNYQTGRDLSTFSPHTFPEINETKPLHWALEQFELPVVPVAGPSSLQPYSASPLGANGNFNFSVPAVIPNGWHPDQATTENFLGYDSPAIPVAGPSSRPYSAPPPRASSRSG
ncbi:hypothetical protein PGT21_005910 [Puccinia graminis f. sp. tritici]|uniref:Uncharacterized protein n=1 Tax=Puccinia graminis f. sp. tritici TaxID=56615 RepID=A0A5B0ME64_PUCGR|nr:hypothetical protein PGT21_005910 [Puccinia graminis f. sp. tritici]